MFEGNGLWQGESAARREADVFSITPIPVFAKHCALSAKLLVPLIAVDTLPACDHVVQANPVTHLERGYRCAGFLNDPGDFMAQGERQGGNRRDAGAVMRIRVADAGRPHVHQHILWAARK